MQGNKIFDGKTVLVTGGTGTLGSAFVKFLVSHIGNGKVIIYSRGEHAQVKLKRELSNENIRFLIGDIRDKQRLSIALKDVDYVLHAAALKHVDVCEYNAIEAVQTNVVGAQNLLEAAIERGVKKVLAVSTDKAVNPINLYGAAKLCADKLFVNGNWYAGKHNTKFSVVRFGNFWESNGSVVTFFKQLRDQGKTIFPITDYNMQRFFIEERVAIERIVDVFNQMDGGEIYIPKMEERYIVDVAKQILSTVNFEKVGIRKGEKMREELVAEDDKSRTVDTGIFYVTKES